MAKAKLRNTRRLYEYHLEHPKMSYAAISRMFHITRQRAGQIIKRYNEESTN